MTPMTKQYVSNEDLVTVPQWQLDEWRYNPDPMTRLRAEAESHRRLALLLAPTSAAA